MATTIKFQDDSTLVLDATISHKHGRNSEVTKHKVESGVDVSDHLQPQPHTLSIEGIVAYRPLKKEGETLESAPHQRAFERIERAIDRGELVTVYTGLKTYPNMAITSFDAPREVNTGYDLVLSLSLVEVRFATAKTVKVPKDAIGKPKPNASPAAVIRQRRDTQDGASPPRGKGRVPPKPTSQPKPQKTAKDTKPKSLLKFGWDTGWNWLWGQNKGKGK